MINAVIIDDEIAAVETLIWELDNFNDQIKIVGSFTHLQDASEFLKNNMIDALFLDVEMPEMNGFEFLENFTDRKFAVIITTAYSHYAFPAIKKQCLDILTKPTASDALKETIKKIEEYKKNNHLISYVEDALLKNETQEEKKIVLNHEGKVLFLHPNEIIYCESQGNYSTIFLEENKKIFLTQQLKYVEEKLTDDFYRIHNSYIVNLNKIQQFIKNEESVVLSNNIKIPVSRRRKTDFLKKFV